MFGQMVEKSHHSIGLCPLLGQLAIQDLDGWTDDDDDDDGVNEAIDYGDIFRLCEKCVRSFQPRDRARSPRLTDEPTNQSTDGHYGLCSENTPSHISQCIDKLCSCKQT